MALMENANVEYPSGNQFEMAASSASDIPESKSDYCPCNRCTVARKQGRQEIIDSIRELHYAVNDGGCGDPKCCSPSDSVDFCIICNGYEYPCETIKILDGIK
jgi:hypothetical protein